MTSTWRSLTSILALAILWPGTAAVTLDASGGLNLLILQTDEHHFNTLGCYGGTIVATPQIDWIAKNGVLCTSFYATTPVCSPSRASFVSGRYPHNTPVITNNIPLDDNIVTFAEVLRRRGYSTGYAGKWHLDGQGKPQWAPARKFGFEDNRFMFNRGHWKQLTDTASGPAVAARDQRGRPNYSVEGADDESFTTDWLTTKAIQFIESQDDTPFCYMVSYPDPHGPNSVRAPYDAMYADVEVPIPASLDKADEQAPAWGAKSKAVTAASLRKIMPAYYGMVKCIDDNVGRILETLRRRELLERTIIVFTADHGDLCGEHGRLNKGVPYEGSAKIPFLMYCPGKIAPGTVVDEALSCVDFLPTIMTLLELPAADGVEGRDASALLTGARPDGWSDVAFLRSTGTSGWLCAVSDRYKLVYSEQDEPWLFDLKDDPDELVNAFHDADSRRVAKRLTEALVDYCRRYGDPRGENSKIESDLRAALR
jgi:arylsulfatase A-like enzyme